MDPGLLDSRQILEAGVQIIIHPSMSSTTEPSTLAKRGCISGIHPRGFHYIDTLYVRHYLAYNTSREGFQAEHVNYIDASKGTVKLVGQTGGAGQNNTVQIHDSNGTIEGFIFDDAPTLWNIFTHGFTFNNCTFIFNAKGFIGDATTAYFAGSSRLNGQLVLFNNCKFIYVGAGNVTLTDIAEVGCNYEFRNCTFTSNIIAIYNDIRAGSPTNSLIGTISTNGNTTASLTRPTYTNFTATSFTTHGLCTSPYYISLSQGFRSK